MPLSQAIPTPFPDLFMMFGAAATVEAEGDATLFEGLLGQELGAEETATLDGREVAVDVPLPPTQVPAEALPPKVEPIEPTRVVQPRLFHPRAPELPETPEPEGDLALSLEPGMELEVDLEVEEVASFEDLLKPLKPTPRPPAPILGQVVEVAAPDTPEAAPAELLPALEAPPEIAAELTETFVPPEAPPEAPKQVRVHVDEDLELELRTDGEGVEVLLEGAPKAIQELAELAPELRNELSQSGFELLEFEARERDQRSSEPPSQPANPVGEDPEGADQAEPANTPLPRGHSLNAIA